MSVAVNLLALDRHVAEAGRAAFLITVSAEGTPHVVSASVISAKGGLALRVGRHSRANLAAHPCVTLLWPAAPGGDYSLLVDGRVDTLPDADGGAVTVIPGSAVWHRVADAAGSGPTCLPVE